MDGQDPSGERRATRLSAVLAKLVDVRASGEGYMASCPAHDDRTPSLTVRTTEDGRILLHCFAGCALDDILHAMGLERRDLFPDGAGSAGSSAGLTLEQLADAKRLPVSLLHELRLSDITYQRRPAVRIPYLDPEGEVAAVRFRLALNGVNRFAWKRGSRALPYGLERLGNAKQLGWLLLVEGESDCWTGWHHGLPILGIPGKTIWRAEWASPLRELDVYLWQEPDAEDFALRVARDIPSLRIIAAPDGIKDLSEAHLRGVDLGNLLGRLRENAVPADEIRKAEDAARLDDLRDRAAPVLDAADPIAMIGAGIRALGYGGDLRSAIVVYLAVTTRVLAVRPGTMLAHLLLLGPAGAGKSYTVQVVLRLLPAGAYEVIDAGSPRVLIYMEGELRHRVLVYGEADSIPAGEDNPAASAIRNLLQDNRLSYQVVTRDPTSGAFGVQEVMKEGPTVLVTTALKSLGHQLTTRLFVLEVPDDSDQVRAALAAQGILEVEGVRDVDEALVAFQEYLQLQAPWDVVVPFAPGSVQRSGGRPRPPASCATSNGCWRSSRPLPCCATSRETGTNVVAWSRRSTTTASSAS